MSDLILYTLCCAIKIDCSTVISCSVEDNQKGIYNKLHYETKLNTCRFTVVLIKKSSNSFIINIFTVFKRKNNHYDL